MPDSDLKEIEKGLNEIRKNSKKKIHPFEVSKKFKSPFKLVAIIEIQSHRVYDLGNTSFNLLSEGKVLSSLMMNRAILESVAYLYDLLVKIETSLNQKNFEQADKYLMGKNFGGRDGLTDYEATNILTALDNADKKLEKIRSLYDMLSEYSHPNYSGCFDFYCTIEKDGWHHLDADKTNTDHQYKLAKDSLNVGLGYFSIVYDMYKRASEQVLLFYKEHYESSAT